MAYYGNNCRNAELRAENKNGTCKDIHDDDSAAALLWIGFILAIPLQIVMFICALFCACFCLAAMCEDSGTVAPSDDSGAGAFVLGALIGLSLD